MYHITKNKEINPCQCKPECRTKYGQFKSFSAAERFFKESLDDSKILKKDYKMPKLNLRPDIQEVDPPSNNTEDDGIEEDTSAENDSVVEADPFSMFLEQNNNGELLVNVENLYKENGKIRSRTSLKNDPPVLLIENDRGDSVNFSLTHNFTKGLMEILTNVDRAYWGHGPKDGDVTTGPKLKKYEEIIQWVAQHKVAVITILLALIVISGGFISEQGG